jgi:hypothetical protein
MMDPLAETCRVYIQNTELNEGDATVIQHVSLLISQKDVHIKI